MYAGQSDGNYCSHDGEHYLKLNEEWEREVLSDGFMDSLA
jgi:hypothetical protein